MIQMQRDVKLLLSLEKTVRGRWFLHRHTRKWVTSVHPRPDYTDVVVIGDVPEPVPNKPLPIDDDWFTLVVRTSE